MKVRPDSVYSKHGDYAVLDHLEFLTWIAPRSVATVVYGARYADRTRDPMPDRQMLYIRDA